ncbi:MAG: DUF1707 SHOCT-like domain-containing protein [Sciscionella sp.]
MNAEQTNPQQRASDADRQRVVDVVHRAVGAGMLDLTEADERMRAAYAATFRGELAPLTADLPAPTPRRPRRTGGPPPAALLVLPLIALVIIAAPVHWPIFPLAFLFIRFVLLRGRSRAAFGRGLG